MFDYLLGTNGPSGYGSASTAEQIASDHAERVKGATVLVTGAASGIGLETARALAKFGATVYVGARSSTKAEDAIRTIRETVPDAKLKPFVADLGSLKSIKAGAEQLLAENGPLNILINNAGVMACPLDYTEDGLEMQFGTNHIGHYYLTILLLPVLQRSAPSRVVNLSSSAHAMCYRSGIQFDDLDGKKSYSAWSRYGHSKMANILFARGMQERNVPGVSFYSLHPGVIATNLQRYMPMSGFFGHFPGMKTIPQGAATTIFCALSDKAVAGEFHADCNVQHSSRHRHFKDLAMAKQLLQVSEDIVKQKTASFA